MKGKYLFVRKEMGYRSKDVYLEDKEEFLEFFYDTAEKNGYMYVSRDTETADGKDCLVLIAKKENSIRTLKISVYDRSEGIKGVRTLRKIEDKNSNGHVTETLSEDYQFTVGNDRILILYAMYAILADPELIVDLSYSN